MIPWWAVMLLILGVNAVLWGSAGAFRLAGDLARRVRGFCHRHGGLARAVLGALLAPLAVLPAAGAVRALRARLARRRGGGAAAGRRRGTLAARAGAFTVDDVAVLIPAHNEAVVIGDSLRAIMALVPSGNVHVVSDGSTDGTAAIARRAGAKVIETRANAGKAGALQEAIERFSLVGRFPLLMLLDADTRVQPGYFTAALPLFSCPQVVAVAGCVRTARGRELSPVGRLLISHRERIYAIGQRVLKFGQTWLRMNATHIVPGFASMYRTEAIPRIEMNPPGLVIEDFNMTFEVYQKRLGKVGFTLAALAVTQDPDTFHDYVRQTRRWAIGLWQTVRRHPPRANLFTVMLLLMLLELITSSLIFVAVPPVLAILLLPDMPGNPLALGLFSDIYAVVSAHVTLTGIAIGILVPDLALTVIATVANRNPRLLLLAPFFPFMRLIDSVIGLLAIPAGLLRAGTGRWKSPARRPVRQPTATGEEAGLAGGAAAAGRPLPAGAATEDRSFVGDVPHASG